MRGARGGHQKGRGGRGKRGPGGGRGKNCLSITARCKKENQRVFKTPLSSIKKKVNERKANC